MYNKEIRNITWENKCNMTTQQQINFLKHEVWEALRKNYWLKDGAKEEDGLEAAIKPAVRFIKQGIVIDAINVDYEPYNDPQTGEHVCANLNFHVSWKGTVCGKSMEALCCKETAWSIDCDRWHNIKEMNMSIYKDVDQALRKQTIFLKDSFDAQKFAESKAVKNGWEFYEC